jgi:hypothetical protein
MAGKVLGKYFSEVIGQLLSSSDAEASQIAREWSLLGGIDPEAERSWDEFLVTLARVAEHVRPRELIEVGQRIIQASKPDFERWGFDTADKILADWDAPFGAIILDAPEQQSVVTLKYQPGQAFVRAGAMLPAELIEGYLRGVLAMFGAELIELHCHRIGMDEHPYHLFELRWRASAVPRPLGRQLTDRLVLGIRSQRVA